MTADNHISPQSLAFMEVRKEFPPLAMLVQWRKNYNNVIPIRRVMLCYLNKSILSYIFSWLFAKSQRLLWQRYRYIYIYIVLLNFIYEWEITNYSSRHNLVRRNYLVNNTVFEIWFTWFCKVIFVNIPEDKWCLRFRLLLEMLKYYEENSLVGYYFADGETKSMQHIDLVGRNCCPGKTQHLPCNPNDVRLPTR